MKKKICMCAKEFCLIFLAAIVIALFATTLSGCHHDDMQAEPVQATAAPAQEQAATPATTHTPAEPSPEPSIEIPEVTTEPEYRLQSDKLPQPDPKYTIVVTPDTGADCENESTHTAQSVAVDPLAMEIFDRTNQARTQHGLLELTYGYELQDGANTRAYECSTQFSHTRPNGQSCHSIVEDMDYYVTGENLIMVDKPIALPEVIVSKWMTSEGHRANILLPEFTKLAVGVYEKDGIVYAAQIFIG